MKFVNLHAHTVFSINDGLNYPKEHFDFVVKNAESDSMAMAITDHGNCSSFGYAFQAAADLKKKGIPFKFLPGAEFYYHPDLEDWAKTKKLKETGVEVEEKPEEGIVIEIEGESKGKWYDPIKRRHHLVVVAYNQIGLINLYKLVSRSYREGFYRYPRVDNRMLEECNEGLIISTACVAGLPYYLTARDPDANIIEVFDKELKPLLEIFGKDRAYLEIQFNKLEEQKLVNEALIAYSMWSGYKLLATADSHYAQPEYWKDRELYRLLGWQTKNMDISLDDLPKSKEDLKCELYPKNGTQMYEEFLSMYDGNPSAVKCKFVKEAINRGYDIAHNLCEFVNQSSEIKLPKIKDDSQAFLEEMAWKGLEEKNLHEDQEYADRLKFELAVIGKKKFADYFVVLYKAMTEIQKKQLASPGRGSAAGSLVLYVLDITQLDPIKNKLLFERFLSEHRSDPPDVDLDSDDRNTSLGILKELFGETEVIPITNYNTLQLKSLVKSISKLYGIPYQDVNDVTTAIDDEAKRLIIDDADGDQKLAKMTHENVLKHSKTYRDFINKYPYVGDHVSVLFNQIKSIGRHAGGVAITQCSEESMPVIRVKGEDQTPWTEGLTAKHLEPAGIIKYDFLAIQTLGHIRRCIEIILQNELDRKPSFEEIKSFYVKNLHPNNVGDGDINVFENIYHAGRFPGIFQFAQPGAQKLCVDSLPTKVSDISIITSIYRPGPLAGKADERYVDAVHNPESVIFDHPIIEGVLKETYGLIVYQEQFMELAHKLAGFTLEEANDLRKLLMKPITSIGDELIEKRKEAGDRFIEGCVEKGVPFHKADNLWNKEILGYISYGFNKSHALAYSYVSYQCSWLFNYYPDEWVCAYLENESDRDKAIEDVESVGYTVGKPDILKSSRYWTVHNKTLIPSLQTIKGIGDGAVDELIEIRKSWKFPESEDLGRDYFLEIFESFFYNIEETLLKNGKTKTKKKWKFSKFNKRALEALIKLEAFDSMSIVGPGLLFENYAHFHRSVIENWSKKEQVKFNLSEVIENTNKKDWSDSEKIDFQVEILGTYDKELSFTSADIANLEDVGIMPLGMVSDRPQSTWFILDDWKMAKTAAAKKEYYKLYISDLTGQKKILNYFLPIRDPLKKKAVYGADLYMNGNWLNLAKGSFIVKIK